MSLRGDLSCQYCTGCGDSSSSLLSVILNAGVMCVFSSSLAFPNGPIHYASVPLSYVEIGPVTMSHVYV